MFPLREVLQRAFWQMAWLSASFIAMVCWDVAADDVGWEDALWLPMLAMCYPALLFAVHVCSRVRVEGSGPGPVNEAAEILCAGRGRGSHSAVCVELVAAPQPQPQLDTAPTSDSHSHAHSDTVASGSCQNPLHSSQRTHADNL
jgi:hypothetical protein